MACYLIAGAAGYVGSRLAQRLLSQGHRVRGIVKNPDNPVVEHLASQGMVVWTGDLTRAETLVGVTDGIDYVYNVTSCSILENGSSRRMVIDGNQNLIAACSRSNTVQSYVFTSNIAPYGNTGDTLLTEDSLVDPSYPLGHVMVQAEQTIMDIVRQHHFPAMIMRVGTIYGPERDFIEPVSNGTMIIIGDGLNFVSRIHIDDLLTALERVVVQGQPGAIYNVADDEPTRLLDVCSAISARLGLPSPVTFSRVKAIHSGMDSDVVGMGSASVRMSNARLKHDLELELQYPSCYLWIDERVGVEQAVEVFA